MSKSPASSVDEYIASLPDDRRSAISAVRKVILRHLPAGFEEGMDFGMIGYHVPLSRYPKTYNGHPIGVAALASQKGYMALYLTSVYGDPALRARFEERFRASGKRLDMGKSCVRFKSIDDLPLDLIGEVIARVSVDTLLARYEEIRAQTAQGKPEKARAPRAKKAATTR